MIGKSMMRGVVTNASAFRAAPLTVAVRGMATERQCKKSKPQTSDAQFPKAQLSFLIDILCLIVSMSLFSKHLSERSHGRYFQYPQDHQINENGVCREASR